MKFIIVTGGVLSGLGKGIIASSVGVVMKALGQSPTSIKIDPYLNIDAGLMSPYEHGEVYVLEDGGEVDLDLGNYERFLDITLTREHSITTGKIYASVLERERAGDYLGKTVQMVPHLTEEIQRRIQYVSRLSVGNNGFPNVCIVELGGTVGDMESLPFLQALCQMKYKLGSDMVLLHLALVPQLHGEHKTKPTQQSVKELRSLGIHPDFIICRSKHVLLQEIKNKVALFCQLKPENVIGVHDVSNTYKVPLLLQQTGLIKLLAEKLSLSFHQEEIQSKLAAWPPITETSLRPEDCSTVKPSTINIGLVGKYLHCPDAYLSITKALEHAAMALGCHIKMQWIDPEQEEIDFDIIAVDAILVPGGFGSRGLDGKIAAAKYARENRIPYLGICLGLQIAVIEFARNVLLIENANSTEFDETCPEPVVIFMPDYSVGKLGASMRLGVKTTELKRNTRAWELYGKVDEIRERHRHRYEVNDQYVELLEQGGMRFTGMDLEGQRMEILELEDHPYFLATQFHPEFSSRPSKPSPVFLGLVQSALGK